MFKGKKIKLVLIPHSPFFKATKTNEKQTKRLLVLAPRSQQKPRGEFKYKGKAQKLK